VIAVELRPPRAELEAAEGMDAWIDTYHAIRSLNRHDVRVMVTDSAVGAQEENNLRHLVANLGDTVPRHDIIPFLTTKHSLEFCLAYADQTVQSGFPSLVVLGGDKHVGRARCLEHAWQLRHAIRQRHPDLELGGWANPAADAAQQVEFLLGGNANADFYLTQIVSHHRIDRVRSFLDRAQTEGLALPGVFGVFYYRSANRGTLETLSRFLPVPVAELQDEFSAGATPVDICARTIKALVAEGARHFYVSNLPIRRAAATLNEILDKAGLRTANRELRMATSEVRLANRE
jgi:5,10-methylenetetrahydrofolate reductase